jgi:hypothetical protein
MALTGDVEMIEFKKANKLWFAWDPDKIERYLEEMSLGGWHVVQVDGMLVSFLFERGEPKRIRYCMDYQRQEIPDYRQIFADDGWSLLHNSMGWYVWSKEYDLERPSIYTDVDSLIARNRNIMLMVAAVLVTQAPMVTINAANLAHTARTNPAIFVLLVAILVVVYGLLLYCIFHLSRSIRRLKRRRG